MWRSSGCRRRRLARRRRHEPGIRDRRSAQRRRPTLRGSRRRFVIGPYPEFTLAQAREAIAEARKLIARGTHPIDQRRAEQEAQDESARAPTLAKFISDEWLPAVLASERSASHLSSTQRIAREIVEALGPRRVREVTRRDLVLLLDRIDQRAPAVGGKARTALRHLFDFAERRGVIDDNPATRLPSPQPTRAVERALSDDEIVTLLRAFEAMPVRRRPRLNGMLALRLILLTGQRPGEVAGMRWRELDLQAGVWRCPQDERRKNRPKALPLSRQVVDLIDSIPRVHFDSGDDPVFVGQADEQMQRHVFATWLGNLFTRAPELLGNLRPFTPHDLRRTCRTGLARLGVDHVVAECVLGHRMPGVAGVYDRHDYVPEMRAALQRWADHVERIVSGEALGNVVEMRGR